MEKEEFRLPENAYRELNEGEEYNLTPGNGWLMEITKGSQYKQINIPDTSETGVSVFVDQGKLVY